MASPAVTRFTIGRDKNCDVAVADDSVSRFHAELTLEDGNRLLLSDRGSSNGTRLIRAGKAPVAIQQEVVFPSDQVQFGNAVLTVADILDTLRRRHPDVFAPQQARAAPAPAGPPRLVRCLCGAIKTQNQKCPECGE